MGASLDPTQIVEYIILSKMSDTIEFLLKQDLEVQICCICGLFFSEMGNFLSFSNSRVPQKGSKTLLCKI